MSAFVLTKEHIDVLVTAALEMDNGSRWSGWFWKGNWHQATFETRDRVGKMLLAENIRSVEHRYPGDGQQDDTLQDPYVLEYVFREAKRGVVAQLKALDCFEYQASETDDWKETEAFAFCNYTRLALITTLPGYADAPWGEKEVA